jgi:hypothetical protein
MVGPRVKQALSDKELSLRSQSGLPRMRRGGAAIGEEID